jgi:uncharacterized protein YfdQ (DUF2303 family)
LEKEKKYTVKITPEAEYYYYELLEYLFKTHTPEKVDLKSNEIIDLAFTLEKYPYRGSVESKLDFLGKKHRYLLYKVTQRKDVKILYIIDEHKRIVYVVDFFGTEMDDNQIKKRNM